MPRSRSSGAWCSTRGFVVPQCTLALVALATAACSKDTVDPSRNAVDTVVVVPAVATMALGATITLQAEARDAAGNLLNREAFWSVGDSAMASVSIDGAVTAHRLGQVEIAASVEGKSGLSSITITRAPVASVRVLPANASLVVGGSTTLSLEARDASGALLSGRVVTWSSSNLTVASVTNAGVVTALSAGAAIISAVCEGLTGLASVNVAAAQPNQPPPGQASVTVTPATATVGLNQTVQLTAVYRDNNGRVVDRDFQWSTANSHIATVTNKGKVTGRGPGTVSIKATTAGVSGTAVITVR